MDFLKALLSGDWIAAIVFIVLLLNKKLGLGLDDHSLQLVVQGLIAYLVARFGHAAITSASAGVSPEIAKQLSDGVPSHIAVMLANSAPPEGGHVAPRGIDEPISKPMPIL